MATVEHPYVVRVYSFGEVEGRPYFVMEYVEGESLAQRLKRGRLPIAEALAILRDVVAGLEAAWEKGIVHRDIKPSNTGGYMLMFPRNRVRVLARGGVTSVPAFVMLGMWILIQLVSGFGSIANTEQTGGVAFMAHVGGFVAGLLLVRLFARGRAPAIR